MSEKERYLRPLSSDPREKHQPEVAFRAEEFL